MATSTLPHVRAVPSTHVDPTQRAWIRLSIAAGIGGVAGVVLGYAMPRGPITTWQALTSMLLCLAGGAVAGFSSRTRWANLGAPLCFLTAFELGRRGLVS